MLQAGSGRQNFAGSIRILSTAHNTEWEDLGGVMSYFIRIMGFQSLQRDWVGRKRSTVDPAKKGYPSKA